MSSIHAHSGKQQHRSILRRLMGSDQGGATEDATQKPSSPAESNRELNAHAQHAHAQAAMLSGPTCYMHGTSCMLLRQAVLLSSHPVCKSTVACLAAFPHAAPGLAPMQHHYVNSNRVSGASTCGAHSSAPHTEAVVQLVPAAQLHAARAYVLHHPLQAHGPAAEVLSGEDRPAAGHTCMFVRDSFSNAAAQIWSESRQGEAHMCCQMAEFVC